jgi:hypothetical protein
VDGVSFTIHLNIESQASRDVSPLAGVPPRPGRLLHRCNRPKEPLCFFVPVEPRRWTLPCGVRFVAFGQTNQASGSVAPPMAAGVGLFHCE